MRSSSVNTRFLLHALRDSGTGWNVVEVRDLINGRRTGVLQTEGELPSDDGLAANVEFPSDKQRV